METEEEHVDKNHTTDEKPNQIDLERWRSDEVIIIEDDGEYE